MFDISHMHVLIDIDCKFSLVHEQNFISTCLGLLTEIRSVFHSIKAYYYKKVKNIEKKNNDVNIQMHFGN